MSLSARDRWIRFGLLPLAALFLGLHVREVVRTGLWQPPVYAVRGPGAGAYPVVGGETLEVAGAPHELRPGDRLLRIGERDLRGRGYLGFMGLCYEQAGARGAVRLVAERAGERFETELVLARFAVPWLRIPFLALMWLIIAFVSWRRPGDPVAQYTTTAFAAVIAGESVFEGGGLAQTVAAKLVFILGGAVWWPLLVRGIAWFPEPVPRPLPRWTRAAMLASALLWTLPKLQYLLGGPTPAERIPTVNSACEALTIFMTFALFGMSYRRADEAKRRSLRWIFWATSLAGLLMVGATSLPLFGLAPGTYPLAIAAAGVAAAVIPVGFLIAMMAYDLFDIDRLISATASYSLLLVAFLAVLLAFVPALAASTAPALGLDPEASRLFLSVLAAALVVPGAQWLRPRMDAFFFPERARVEAGIGALLAEQAREDDPEGIARLVAQRVREVFEPEFAVAFVPHGDSCVPLAAADAPPLEPLGAGEPLLRELGDASPLVLDPRQRAGRRVGTAGRVPRPLADAGVALLLAVRAGEALRAFVAVGRKRSGDVYTGNELTLLRATLEAAGRQLDRAREARTAEQERHRAESLDRDRRRLAAAHLARSRQLAAASHDLRQPLHALRLSAEALRERLAEGGERAIAERIQSSAESLHEMFDSLIDLARMDQGTLVPSVQELALAPLLERLTHEAEPLAAAKGLALTCEAGSAWVRSDPILLGRIVQNLLANAVRYTREGSVCVRVRETGGNVTIDVLDTGPGIPRELHVRIFEEFVRLEASGDERGLGLGLSIVRRLGDLLGHAIALESHPGSGSRFSVTLAAAPAREPRAAAAPGPADFRGRRVLVVDDDLEVLASVRALLEGWGIRVLLATDREEALAACGNGLDAVLADYRLARGEKGTELVAEVRAALGWDVPAIVVTGSTSREVFDEVGAAGLPCLPKPLAPARLRAALAAAFGPPPASGR